MDPKEQIDRPSSSLLDRISKSGLDDATQAFAVEGSQRAERFQTGAKVSRRQHVRRMTFLRSQIQRDLMQLLGTRRMADQNSLSRWPMVQQSVLNYGIPDLSGSTASSLDIDKTQRELLTTIRQYEPRLHPQSIVVECVVVGVAQSDVNVKIDALFGPADAMESFEMTVSISLNDGNLRSAA